MAHVIRHLDRRRLLQTLATSTAASTPAPAQNTPAAETETLRAVAAFGGHTLDAERLRILKPALDRRRAQLQSLRDLELDDAIAPRPGVLR